MAETDPLRHVTDSIKNAIPTSCVSCPALLGNVSVRNEFIDDAIARRKRALNPITKIGNLVCQRFSERRLNKYVQERLLEMQSCVGALAYPADTEYPAILCGLGVQDAISEQITNQPLRT
jgi:hypothetical protein